MNVLALFGLGLLMIIVQTTVFRLVGVSYLKAPLVLSVVIYAGFQMKAIRGLVLSFLAGFAVDVYTGGIQGVTPIVMVLLCLGGRWMSRGMIVEGNLALAVVAFAFCLLHNILWMGMEALAGGRTPSAGIPVGRILLQSVVFALMSPILVRLAAVVDSFFTIGWRELWRSGT